MVELYFLCVWLHIVAAATWLGGMLFLALVLVPVLRRVPRAQTAPLFRATARRFRNLSWVALGVLAITGTYNLWIRGVSATNLLQPDWLGSPFGRTVVAKLSLFVLVLIASLVHDFAVGPRASAALETADDESTAARWRRGAAWLGRATAAASLVLVALGVILVRGSPW